MHVVPHIKADHTANFPYGASFAPGGDRTRTGVVINGMYVIVHMCACRHALATSSAHEAELNGTVAGVHFGLPHAQRRIITTGNPAPL